MMHFMVCVSGFSGVGKDEFCKRLVQSHSAVQTGLADPMKRHMADLYGFSEDQLFGPSASRNAGDLRYPKGIMEKVRAKKMTKLNTYTGPDTWLAEIINDDPETAGIHVNLIQWSHSTDPKLPQVVRAEESPGPISRYFFTEGDPRFWLSPREALQQYGELMNSLYLDSWVRKGIEDHKKIASEEFLYSKMGGLIKDAQWTGRYKPEAITCFSDFRHWHEVRAARRATSEELTPVLIRIRSKRVPNPPYQHRSEVEQTTIPDSEFDFVIHNDKGVDDLHHVVDWVTEMLRRGSWIKGQEVFT